MWMPITTDLCSKTLMQRHLRPWIQFKDELQVRYLRSNVDTAFDLSLTLSWLWAWHEDFFFLFLLLLLTFSSAVIFRLHLEFTNSHINVNHKFRKIGDLSSCVCVPVVETILFVLCSHHGENTQFNQSSLHNISRSLLKHWIPPILLNYIIFFANKYIYIYFFFTFSTLFQLHIVLYVFSWFLFNLTFLQFPSFSSFFFLWAFFCYSHLI